MQLTNKSGYDQKKLENDIVYNIEAGVEVLSGMYSRMDLPKIKGAGRQGHRKLVFPCHGIQWDKTSEQSSLPGNREKKYECISRGSFC